MGHVLGCCCLFNKITQPRGSKEKAYQSLERTLQKKRKALRKPFTTEEEAKNTITRECQQLITRCRPNDLKRSKYRLTQAQRRGIIIKSWRNVEELPIRKRLAWHYFPD